MIRIIYRLFPEFLKHLIKKYLRFYFIKEKLSSVENNIQKQKVIKYQQDFSKGITSKINNVGYKKFSQFEEDGILLYIFSLLNFSCPTFVEFGADDGINSNSANLIIHHGFNGLFIDGNKKALNRGEYFFKRYVKDSKLVFHHAFITAENINELINSNGINEEIGLLSIDIDGNDYWVWKAITSINPQVVVIETHNEFGMNDIIVPYDSTYFYPGIHPDYHGASPVAMNKLANSKGYRLIGANELGFNFFFLRNDLLPQLKECTIQSCLQHPSNKEAQKKFEPIKNWKYVKENI